MLTYVLLDLVVLAGLGLLVLLRPKQLAWKPILVVLAALLVMTAVFDSMIVYEHIVAYDGLKILGIYIGKAPIEDFSYTLAVVILVPYLWKSYADKN